VAIFFDSNTLQHAATHRNTLQHTATHCNTLQHTGFMICGNILRYFRSGVAETEKERDMWVQQIKFALLRRRVVKEALQIAADRLDANSKLQWVAVGCSVL